MKFAFVRSAAWFVGGIVVVGAAAVTAQRQIDPAEKPPTMSKPTEFIPGEIQWPSPPLGNGPFNLLSAEHWKLRVSVVASGLSHPWGMAFLPDGAILITERPGRMRVVRNNRLDPNPVAGVPQVFSQGLSGLLDVALHPQFAQNRYVYFTYHKPAGEKSRVNAVARGTWDGTALTGTRDIFVAQGENGGSRLVFGRDGMLYVSVSGPGSGPTAVRAQDPNDHGGKILRLRDDGTVPPDNPFAGRAGHRPEIYSLGHRSVLSIAVNPENGELWAGEQGPNGGDEINVIQAGKNYGWPVVSDGRTYNGPRVSERPWQEGMEQPIVKWVPSIAVSGMLFYTGDKFPAWKRNVLVGGLREGEIPRTGQIHRIVFNNKWEELRREPLLRELHQRIRDVRQGPDGNVYALTDEDNGALLRIEPGETTSTATR